MVKIKTFSPESHVLTPEGLSIAQNGSHEYLFWSSLSAIPTTIKEIEAQLGKDVTKIGQGKAMKNKWATKSGDGFIQGVRCSSCQESAGEGADRR